MRRLQWFRQPPLHRFGARLFSVSSESQYIEHWQRLTMKTNEFYETHAKDRTYFYSVDLQGRLFLEETSPKNIATSLKSEKFLNFFTRLMRRNDTSRFVEEYPYYSPCGLEHNFIRPADVGLVFHDLTDEGKLIFGGSLTQEFRGDCLAYSERTGRFYHRLFGRKAHLQKSGKEYGLLKSSIAGVVANDIEFIDDGRMVFDKEHILPPLPAECESTDWGLPPHE